MAKEKLYLWDFGPADIAGEGSGELNLTIEDCVSRYVRELDPIIDNMHESCGDISVSDMSTMFSLFFLNYNECIKIAEIYETAGIKFDFSASYVKELVDFIKEELEQLG